MGSFTLAAFVSLYSEDGFPDFGRSVTFEWSHLNIIPQFLFLKIKAYNGQN